MGEMKLKGFQSKKFKIHVYEGSSKSSRKKALHGIPMSKDALKPWKCLARSLRNLNWRTERGG